MPRNLLIGGFLPEHILNRILPSLESSSAFQWQSSKSGLKAFLWVQGNNFARVESGRYLIIGLGHISNDRGDVGETVLREIERNLHHHSCLPIKSLEGSFSIVTVDKNEKTMMIYRNIAGLPCIYYINNNRLTLFSDNISYLVSILSTIVHQKLAINSPQLVSHFLYSGMWGETLFKNIRRIIVGEQIFLEANKVSRGQMQKIGDMATSHIRDCASHLEKVMKKIIKEYVATYSNIVNIFSGGVDSSYIQAHLSKCYGSGIQTFSLDLISDSPIWKREREYARSGSLFFQTNHTFVRVLPSEYPKLLIRGISERGLPLRGPQDPLLSKLFKSVKKASSVATCGLCADVLFGDEICQDTDIAYFVDKVMPFKPFRECLLKISKSLHKRTGARAMEKLTSILELDLHDCSSPKHPFNISTDLEAVCKLFGYAEVTEVVSERQALMKQFQIKGLIKERLSSFNVLACAQGVSERFYQLASNVGLSLLFPYLDSRMIKAALSMGELRFPHGKTKKVIKDALRNYLPRKLILRKKSAWGLPIFEWMAPGGVLYSLVKELENSTLPIPKYNVAEAHPDHFTWNLLNFDIWYKQFLDNLKSRPKIV